MHSSLLAVVLAMEMVVVASASAVMIVEELIGGQLYEEFVVGGAS